jgi:putative toxin-antitoxin system antitoxin component (TIGR02293 family)
LGGVSRRNAEAEPAERLARIVALAEKAWENRADALAFLTEPHPMLDDSTPLEAAATESGARRVERLLVELEYSLPI